MSWLFVVLVPAALMVTATGLERLENRLDSANAPVEHPPVGADRDASQVDNSLERIIAAEPGWPPLSGYSPANP